MALDVYKEWLGIPEGPRPPDHYQLLRLVQFEDTADKIRANYKKLNAHVRKYASGQYSTQSQELLNELAKAMLCLTDAERKKEYDQSLGREFEEDKGRGGRKTMDALLIERNLASVSQIKEAKEFAERGGLDLRDALVQLKVVEPAVAAQALAEEVGLPYVDLADMLPDDAVLDKVPRKLVKQHSILPLFIDQDRLLVACVDLISPELEEELRLRFGIPVRGVLTAPFAITQGIAKYYAPGLRNEAAAEETPGKGAKPAKKSGEAPAPKKVRLSTAEEKKQMKQYGIIALNFSFVTAYLLDTFVITPHVYLDIYTFLLFTIIPGITGFFVWQTCFKR